MYGCGKQEAGLANGSGWDLWVWLYGGTVGPVLIAQFNVCVS